MFFCTVLTLNSDDVRFICLKLKLQLRRNPVSKYFFIAQISHTPGVSNSNCCAGETRT